MQITFQHIRLARPIRFALVGVSGLAVNSTLLWALARGAHLMVPVASALATEAAILSNFALNDRWTFRDSGAGSVFGRLVRFNGVALGGMAITTAILVLLTSFTTLHLLVANALAVGVATTWNYLANSWWTWAKQKPAKRPLSTADPDVIALLTDERLLVDRKIERWL